MISFQLEKFVCEGVRRCGSWVHVFGDLLMSGVLSAKRFVSFADVLSVRGFSAFGSSVSVENECAARGILSVNDASSFGSLGSEDPCLLELV